MTGKNISGGKDVMKSTFDLVDGIVEFYLTSAIKPFVKFHETFYNGLNKTLRKLLDDNRRKIPDWFTANFITYARTALTIPTILLLAGGYVFIPAFLVLFVDFNDFLDGVVARFWVDIKMKKEAAAQSKDKRSASSDAEDFEVVTIGTPHTVHSWTRLHRDRTYGGFIDAVCDKLFVVPCWLVLLNTVPTSTYFRIIQYLTLTFLATAEISSACVRFKAYFTSGGVPAPKVEGFDFSNSAVKADHVGKAKQTFEMVGTALFIIGFTRYLGLLLLMAAVPLAYESVRRKIVKRVVYINGATSPAGFNHKKLKFFMQAAAMGSKLVVGIPGEGKVTDMVLNACAVGCVDEVIAEAPEKLDLTFLEKQGIDFVVTDAGQSTFLTDEVIVAKRVLTIGEDGIARPMKIKETGKSE